MDDDVVEGKDVHPAVDVEPEEGPSNLGTTVTKPIIMLCGGVLYAYMLYTVLVSMIYPASVKPFLGLENTGSTTHDGTCWAQLTVDALLLLIFYMQHTGMANAAFKTSMANITPDALQRPLYSLASCVAIQVIYEFWRPTPSFTLWRCESDTLHMALAAVQLFCWVSVACSLFLTDYLELLGVKQLYYSQLNMGDPLLRKAAEQQRLLRHMRHPLFFGPLLILWAVPIMNYDRFLIAVMVPLYLIWGCHLDAIDADYTRGQFAKKKDEIFGTTR